LSIYDSDINDDNIVRMAPHIDAAYEHIHTLCEDMDEDGYDHEHGYGTEASRPPDWSNPEDNVAYPHGVTYDDTDERNHDSHDDNHDDGDMDSGSYDGDYYDYGHDDDRDDGDYDAGEASDGYYSDDNYGSYYNYYSD
jgi:hypothetical protein